MEIIKNAIIQAPAEQIWDIMGERYAEVGSWFTGVAASKPRAGDKLPGAPTMGRECSSSFGDACEVIDRFDARRRELVYHVESGMPGFVKLAQAHWKFTPRDEHSCSADLRMVMEVSWWAAPMGLMMKRQMGRLIDDMFEELDHYATTGEVHPRKSAQIAKQRAA